MEIKKHNFTETLMRTAILLNILNVFHIQMDQLLVHHFGHQHAVNWDRVCFIDRLDHENQQQQHYQMHKINYCKPFTFPVCIKAIIYCIVTTI